MIYALYLSRKQLTHFIRKVFARSKLPSGKFRLFGPLSHNTWSTIKEKDDKLSRIKMKYCQRKRSNCILTCRQVTSIQQSWTCPHQPAQKSPPRLGTSSIISPKPFSSQPGKVDTRYKASTLSKYLVFLLQLLKGLLQVLSIHCCLHFWGAKEKQHTSPWLCFANTTRRSAPRVVACAEAESIIDQTMSPESIA